MITALENRKCVAFFTEKLAMFGNVWQWLEMGDRALFRQSTNHLLGLLRSNTSMVIMMRRMTKVITIIIINLLGGNL